MLRSSASRSSVRQGVWISDSSMPMAAGMSKPTSKSSRLVTSFISSLLVWVPGQKIRPWVNTSCCGSARQPGQPVEIDVPAGHDHAHALAAIKVGILQDDCKGHRAGGLHHDTQMFPGDLHRVDDFLLRGRL